MLKLKFLSDGLIVSLACGDNVKDIGKILQHVTSITAFTKMIVKFLRPSELVRP